MISKDILDIQPFLYSYAMKLTRNRDEALDLVQDTMLKAIEKQQLFKEGTYIKAWTSTIMRNIHFSKFRKNSKMKPVDDMTLGLLMEHVAPSQYISVFMHDLERIMTGLSEEQLRSLTLISIDGLSYEEVAEMENVAVGTIKSRVSRARNYLRETLGELDVDTISLGVSQNDDNQRSSYS